MMPVIVKETYLTGHLRCFDYNTHLEREPRNQGDFCLRPYFLDEGRWLLLSTGVQYPHVEDE